MSLRERLTGWLSEDQHERANVDIGPDHVDRFYAPFPIEADRDYFRVSLAQMYLKYKSQFFQNYYPVVYSLVECSFAGQSVEIPNVVDPSKLLQKDDKGDWITRNVTLLPLMPFRGGTVRIVTGLYAIKGENPMKEFIGVLGGFAKLLAVPQLSAALSVAQPLAMGIQALFGGGGGMHLGYQNTFVGAGGEGANYLQQAYIALVRTNADDSLTNRFFVVKDELREGTGLGVGENQLYDKADFMLLRVEVRDARDDWNELTSIAAPRKVALQALVDADVAKADAQHRQSLLGAYQAPEITGTDRRRVIELLKREYNEAKNQLGASNLAEATKGDFQKQMDRSTISVTRARALGEPTYDELFAI